MTLSPAQKAAATRKANKAKAAVQTRAMSGTSLDSMSDAALLAMAIATVRPQAEAGQLADAMLARFGSFAETVNASDALLGEVEGAGPDIAAQFKLLCAAGVRISRGEVSKRPVMGSWSVVVEHLRRAMAFNAVEEFRILFLDRKNSLIADEVMSTGTVDHTPVYIREIVKRALQLEATGIILAHNHPSGDPTPSRPDIAMTREIVAAAKPLGISVHDHIIVGRNGHTSLKAEGLM